MSEIDYQDYTLSTSGYRHRLNSGSLLREVRESRRMLAASSDSSVSGKVANAKPLKKKKYRKLKKMKIGKSDQVCVICLEEFKKDQIVVKLPCGHIFHRKCCKKWLLQRGVCPTCRDNVNNYFDHDTDTDAATECEDQDYNYDHEHQNRPNEANNAAEVNTHQDMTQN